MPDVTTIVNYQCKLNKQLDNAIFMQLQQSVGFTCHADVWSTPTKQSFLGLNVEFMNSSFVRVRGTIDLIYLISRHTAENLRSEVGSALRRMKVDAKAPSVPLISMQTDNASNMRHQVPDTVVQCHVGDEFSGLHEGLDLGEFHELFNDFVCDLTDPEVPTSALDSLAKVGEGRWFGDSCHTIQLALKDAFRSSQAAMNILSLCQKFNVKVRNNEQLMLHCRENNLPLPQLNIEVRWSSAVNLLRSWRKICEPLRNVDIDELPDFSNRDLANCDGLIAILDEVTSCMKTLQLADAHCGMTVVAIDGLIDDLNNPPVGNASPFVMLRRQLVTNLEQRFQRHYTKEIALR